MKDIQDEFGIVHRSMEQALVSLEEAKHFAERYVEYYVNYGGSKGCVLVLPDADLYFSGSCFFTKH